MKIDDPNFMKIGKLCFQENRKHDNIIIIDKTIVKCINNLR